MNYKIFKKNIHDNKVSPLMYEVDMLNNTIDLFREVGKYDGALPTVVLESFLLHARVLIDFLEDKRTGKDDLTCSDFIDVNGNDVKKQTVNLQEKIKVKLNKHLAHLTKTRLAEKPGWNVVEIKDSINESMKKFVNECADSNFPDDPHQWRLAFDEQFNR